MLVFDTLPMREMTKRGLKGDRGNFGGCGWFAVMTDQLLHYLGPRWISTLFLKSNILLEIGPACKIYSLI